MVRGGNPVFKYTNQAAPSEYTYYDSLLFFMSVHHNDDNVFIGLCVSPCICTKYLSYQETCALVLTRCSLWIKDFILINIASILVMVTMGDSPAFKRRQNGRVHQVADNEVQAMVARKRAMTTIVSNREEPPENNALHINVR